MQTLGRVRLLRGARAGRHPLRRTGGRDRRHPSVAGQPWARDRPDGAAARAGGLLAPPRRVGAEFPRCVREGVATFEGYQRPSTPTTPTTWRPGPPARPDARLEHVSLLRPRPHRAGAGRRLGLRPERGVTAGTGPSGCEAQSTLLAVLGASLEPTSGTVQGPTRDHRLAAAASGVRRRDLADNLLAACPARTRPAEQLRTPCAASKPDVDPGLVLGEDGTTLSVRGAGPPGAGPGRAADRPLGDGDEPTAHPDPGTEQVIADVVREPGRAARWSPSPTAWLGGGGRPRGHAARPAPYVAVRSTSQPHRRHRPGRPEVQRRRLAPRAHSCPRSSAALPWPPGRAHRDRGLAIVKASYQPQRSCCLLVAIVAVRTFRHRAPRPALRRAGQSHDVVLRALAQRRVEGTTPWSPDAGRTRSTARRRVDRGRRRRRQRAGPRAAGPDAGAGFAITSRASRPGGCARRSALLLPVAAVCAAAGGYLLARRGATWAEQARSRPGPGLRRRHRRHPRPRASSRRQAEDRALTRSAPRASSAGRRTVASATWLATGGPWC